MVSASLWGLILSSARTVRDVEWKKWACSASNKLFQFSCRTKTRKRSAWCSFFLERGWKTMLWRAAWQCIYSDIHTVHISRPLGAGDLQLLVAEDIISADTFIVAWQLAAHQTKAWKSKASIETATEKMVGQVLCGFLLPPVFIIRWNKTVE